MRKCVLVVGGQADLRKLITMTLDFGDFDLHEAEDGMRGLYLARGLRPNLVLLDGAISGEMNGLQICARIKEDPSLAHTRVVLLTTRDPQTVEAGGESPEADPYIAKPFNPLELIDAVDRMLPRSQPDSTGYR